MLILAHEDYSCETLENDFSTAAVVIDVPMELKFPCVTGISARAFVPRVAMALVLYKASALKPKVYTVPSKKSERTRSRCFVFT